MKENISEYRFIIPKFKEDRDYFKKNFKEYYLTSDGSPFCRIYSGYLLPKGIVEYLSVNYDLYAYKLNDRFEDIDDFKTSFMDGDTENDDFIKI